MLKWSLSQKSVEKFCQASRDDVSSLIESVLEVTSPRICEYKTKVKGGGNEKRTRVRGETWGCWGKQNQSYWILRFTQRGESCVTVNSELGSGLLGWMDFL